MADLPENPNNRTEDYLAGIAGDSSKVPSKPWSRKEAYLQQILENGGGGGDIPIASADTLGGIKVGSGLSINSETGVLSASGGGGDIVTLTESDYDYHRTGDTDDGVALWLLDPGIYKVKSGVKVYYHSGVAGSGVPSIDSVINIYGWLDDRVTILVSGVQGLLMCYSVFVSNGAQTSYTVGNNSVLTGKVVVDNLTSSDGYAPLSANQGRVLKSAVDSAKLVLYCDINYFQDGSNSLIFYNSPTLALDERYSVEDICQIIQYGACVLIYVIDPSYQDGTKVYQVMSVEQPPYLSGYEISQSGLHFYCMDSGMVIYHISTYTEDPDSTYEWDVAI